MSKVCATLKRRHLGNEGGRRRQGLDLKGIQKAGNEIKILS